MPTNTSLVKENRWEMWLLIQGVKLANQTMQKTREKALDDEKHILDSLDSLQSHNFRAFDRVPRWKDCAIVGIGSWMFRVGRGECMIQMQGGGGEIQV